MAYWWRSGSVRIINSMVLSGIRSYSGKSTVCSFARTSMTFPKFTKAMSTSSDTNRIVSKGHLLCSMMMSEDNGSGITNMALKFLHGPFGFVLKNIVFVIIVGETRCFNAMQSGTIDEISWTKIINTFELLFSYFFQRIYVKFHKL